MCWYAVKPPTKRAVGAVVAALRAAYQMLPDGFQHRVLSAPPTVIVAPTPSPKTLPPKGIAPRCRDVNSGLTTQTSDGQTVCVIWRREEAVKVILHEYLHAALQPIHPRLNAILANIQLWNWAIAPPIAERVLFSETIIEILAEAILCSKHQFPSLQHWALAQMKKLITHQDLTIEEFFGFAPTNRRFRQETPAFEYFILRAILLCNQRIVAAWSRGPGAVLQTVLTLVPQDIKRVVENKKWLSLVINLNTNGTTLRMTPFPKPTQQ
jgi:hypothetical protein